MTSANQQPSAPDELRPIFVIGPIGKQDADGVDSCQICLDEIIKPAAVAAGGYAPAKRVDEDEKPGMITKRIVTSILAADVCVADLTGKNANVMYEVALAHAANKPVILLQQEAGGPPFDFGAERVIHYGTRADEARKAREALTASLKAASVSAAEDEEFETTFNPVRDLFARLRAEASAPAGEKATWERLDEVQESVNLLGNQVFAALSELRHSGERGTEIPGVIRRSGSVGTFRSPPGDGEVLAITLIGAGLADRDARELVHTLGRLVARELLPSSFAHMLRQAIERRGTTLPAPVLSGLTRVTTAYRAGDSVTAVALLDDILRGLE